ncbi:MAG: phosphatidylglycerol:prolipoprotein diacylglycerol transferase [Gammaproteobacteria bacterium]|jgi:phosphatidylglycerol:prolipoprotein diacylglycerol transferase
MITYPQIDPIALDLGLVQIRWYGLTYLAGLGLAWWLLRRRAKNSNGIWDNILVEDLIFYGAIGVILGGRLGSVIFYNLPYYLSHPVDIFKVWQGGMSFHGGFIGVMIATGLFAIKFKKRIFDVYDYLIPVVPVGLGFGRIGNFVNGELWGAPTDVSWAMIFPAMSAGNIPRHPSQLYEAILEGLLLFIIMWWFSSSARPRMAISGLFMLLYGVFRFAVEFFREPDAHIGYLVGDWLTMGQVLSTPMIIVGIILLFLAYTRQGTSNE